MKYSPVDPSHLHFTRVYSFLSISIELIVTHFIATVISTASPARTSDFTCYCLSMLILLGHS